MQRGHPLAQGLLGCWPAYEGTGPTLNDLSGNDTKGTLQAGASWVGGQSGWALKGTGTSTSYIALGTPAWTVAGPCTFACWFRPAGNGAAGLFKQGASSTTCNLQCGWQRPASSNVLAMGWASIGLGLFGNTTLTANGTVWYHAAFVRAGKTGAWTWQMYLNGNLDASGSSATNPTGGTADSWLGNVPTSNPINGLEDGMLIYNRALAADEIRALYQDTWQMVRPDPEGWWLKAAAAPAVTAHLLPMMGCGV